MTITITAKYLVSKTIEVEAESVQEAKSRDFEGKYNELWGKAEVRNDMEWDQTWYYPEEGEEDVVFK